ncbi:MAG TPA: N-formylglutamate amidohydrolase [Sphingomonas sp.]|nr:N-formylglutamate amidohydrolase [Sphingomonas sp.]
MPMVNMPSALPPLASPVVISVAHAARDYADLGELARVPLDELRPLEDRHADALTADAGPHKVITFGHARAWIDVNREPHDLDSSMIAGVSARILSPRARGGLGLIPRRLSGVGELWRRPLSRAELDARLFDYRAFHAEVELSLASARKAHGRAVLIDVHSMPPLASGVQAVVGNAHGASCDRAMTESILTLLRDAGLKVALNQPYAGGAIVRRHGRPAIGVQAFQIEFDRSLYLDEGLDLPGPGLAGLQNVLRRVADSLAEPEAALPIAAE